MPCDGHLGSRIEHKSEQEQMGIIQLENVSKSYGDKQILRDVYLSVQAGEFVALCGESGAGKSTLLSLIGGLEQPSSGRVVVDMEDVAQMSVRERTDFYRHKVGVIFQGSYLQQQFTLLENIVLPGVFAGMPEDERKERAGRLAGVLGISERLDALPKQVSGGQAVRACIARALLLSPKIILADEPTSNLDEANAEAVLQLLNSIRLQMGVTVVVASHDRDVVKHATRVVLLAGGKVQNITAGLG